MKAAKWRVIQNDPDVLRWYDNVARGSATTAIDRIRLLARYVAFHHTTPGKLVERAKKDRKAIEDQLSDFARRAGESDDALRRSLAPSLA